MSRDPHGRKIGRNDRCWCGSGEKFKNCHWQREFQPSRPSGYYDNRFHQIEQQTRYCSCDFDSANCSKEIVRAHSISKSVSLSEIADDGQVEFLEIDSSKYESSDYVKFKRRGVRLASTVQAFCSHHDNALFYQLDRLDAANKQLFYWQLFYRAVCFECYRKVVAVAHSTASRDIDRGLPVTHQPFVQDFMSRQKLGHSAGLTELQNVKRMLERQFQAGSYSEQLRFLSFEIREKLPVVAVGVFQPDISIDGRILQTVNQMTLADGRVVPSHLDPLCMSIISHRNGTMLSFCASHEHGKSLDFMRSFLHGYRSLVDNFVGLAVLKMENVYFDPKFVSTLSAEGRLKFKVLHSLGIGEDVKPNEMRAAMNLGLFPLPLSIQCTHNLDGAIRAG